VNTPTRTLSAIYPVRLRTDLTRDAAYAYWAGPHAEIAGRLPNLMEYNQYHFSNTDRGYWPATTTVGTLIPPSAPLDGLSEVRLPSIAAGLSTGPHMRDIYLDEQNVFEHCLGHITTLGGGRWWTKGHDDTLGHRTVLLLRRRRGVRGRIFRSFVHSRLGAALHSVGAHDVRTYTFMPLAPVAHATLGVNHENPSDRRYHAAVIFGTKTRADVEGVTAAPEVASAIADQHLNCTAVHAYTVDRTVPVIRMRNREPNTGQRLADGR